MSNDRTKLIRALLEPHPDKLTQALLVSLEESLMTGDALKATLGDLQEVHAKLQELVDHIQAHPSNHEEHQP